MQTYSNIYSKIYSYNNLFLAYKKARKGKSKKNYVIEFEKDLKESLKRLQEELINQIYQPKPLKTFTIRDPKLRKISKSEFRDRIVHHALINIIESIFDKTFIYDSHANRKSKGNSQALLSLNKFIKKITENNSTYAFYLKADIKHYFENVNHKVLINIVKKRIKDENTLLLIKKIIDNAPSSKAGDDGKIGMPLGNLTSQFFANVYLNELDYYVKHKLKVKYYIRYVDDFVILHKHKRILEFYKEEITNFLKDNLKLELNDDKSKIYPISKGVNFLGFRNFYYHQILKKNKRKLLRNKVNLILKEYKENKNYERLMQRIESILAHLELANTFNLRKKIVSKLNNKI